MYAPVENHTRNWFEPSQWVLNDYSDYFEAHKNLERYIQFYNNERRHSSPDKQTPAERYHGYRRERRESA